MLLLLLLLLLLHPVLSFTPTTLTLLLLPLLLLLHPVLSFTPTTQTLLLLLLLLRLLLRLLLLLHPIFSFTPTTPAPLFSTKPHFRNTFVLRNATLQQSPMLKRIFFPQDGSNPTRRTPRCIAGARRSSYLFTELLRFYK